MNYGKSKNNKRDKNSKKDYSNKIGKKDNNNRNTKKYKKDDNNKNVKNYTKDSNSKGENYKKHNDEKTDKINTQVTKDFNTKEDSKVKAICPKYKECGACEKLHIPYEKQLKDKEYEVKDLLGKGIKVHPVIGMKSPNHYRNKVHAVFQKERNGKIISGVYKPGTHKVIPVEKCYIEDEKADEIIMTITNFLKSFKIEPYDEDRGYGLLRHVLIRKGFSTGEIMVVLVVSSFVFPSKNNFVKELLKIHPEITTIVLNLNNKKTSMVLGDKEKVIYGKGYIEDSLLGCTFRISSRSFYQVNPIQTEVLYKKAIELANFTGKEKVIDTYCGIGTIGIILSKKVRKVIGVELNSDAVRDAIDNARLNRRYNARFYKADAGDFMAEMARRGERADVVIMDPPRSGSSEKFMDSLAKIFPKKVVYISCNPETLARDLKYMARLGLKAKEAWPVDMFPQTSHVETVVKLTHKNADGFINVKMEYDESIDRLPNRVTYAMIQEYVESKYGFKVHTAYIAEVKRSLGLPMYDAPNSVEELKYPHQSAPAHKVEAIKDALKHFEVI
ncbi:23S rRNA (uracil(1939)-C(5))-methyltransferase RlmD [Haloimpatiens sp. FM7315]|uniref:23S rRNA (uracil(1939)-C(5))-methyltransferase RlmD n=1 Tax=Haloimpatiens sp. FM7315 TaxID=3298609 RepID=UPI00370BB324